MILEYVTKSNHKKYGIYNKYRLIVVDANYLSFTSYYPEETASRDTRGCMYCDTGYCIIFPEKFDRSEEIIMCLQFRLLNTYNWHFKRSATRKISLLILSVLKNYIKTCESKSNIH